MRRFLLLFVVLFCGTYLSARSKASASTIKIETIPCTDSVRLTMQASADAAYYLWSTGDTGQSVIVTKAGNYSCTVKDGNLQVIDEAMVNVVIPEVSKISIYFSDYFSDTLKVYLRPYQQQNLDAKVVWYKDGAEISGNDYVLALNSSGLYTIVITTMAGCTYSASYNYVDTFHYSLSTKIQVSPCDSTQWLFQAKVENLKPNDSIVSVLYDFGNEMSSYPFNKEVWHTFPGPGTYQVDCRVFTALKRMLTSTNTLVIPETVKPIKASISQHFDTLAVSLNGLDRSLFRYKWTKDMVALPDTGWLLLPTVAGNYAVTVYSASGCDATANFDYRPFALSLHLSANNCDSTMWTISSESGYPSGSPIVSEIMDYGDGTTGESGIEHKYAKAGVYNVNCTLTTAEGRKVTASIPVVVPEFSPLSLSIYLKSGIQDTIFVKPDYRDPSYFTFKWYMNNNLLTDSDYYFIPARSGRYSVFVNSLSGCYYEFSINYRKPASVIPTIGTNGSLQLAADFDTITFNSDNVFNVELTVKNTDSRMLTAEEVISLGTIKGTDPTSLSVSIPDSLACASNYTVRVISSSPADTTNWSGTFTITNQPAQPVITQVGDSLFTSSIYNLQWYKDDVAISGATNDAIRARANGSYKVAALNGAGCTSLSDARAVVITAITNVSLGNNTVSAYPNPSAGPVYLKFGYPLTQKVTVKVYNSQGAVVYTIITSQQQQLLELSALPKGFYIVEVSGYGTRKSLTIVLQ